MTTTLRLDRIVTDLLDLARYESHATALATRVCAIERIFVAVVRRYEKQAMDLAITVSTHIEPAADQLVADPDRLDQAVSNLVANALRHTPQGGTLRLEASASGEAYRIAVTDSGEGISREHLPHVFERFYTVDNARTPVTTFGSGLGLSIVKAVVERHGGEVTVVSQPGRTTFTIILPGAVVSGD